MNHAFEQFRLNRKRGNEAILKTGNINIKRLFSLDKHTYKDSHLDKSTKELLAMVGSLVLRCNDCVDYHLEQCVIEKFTREQIDEAMSVALMIGGTIVIPHMRHAAQSLDFLFEEAANQNLPAAEE